MNESPALLIALAIVVLVDIRSWLAVRYLWQLHGEDRASDHRVPKPRLRLTLVKAIVASITASGTTYLIGITGVRLLDTYGLIDVDYAAITAALSPVTLGVFTILLTAPIVSAEYLRWRRRQALRAGAATLEGITLPEEIAVRHEEGT